jgi:hypothetical protein
MDEGRLKVAAKQQAGCTGKTDAPHGGARRAVPVRRPANKHGKWAAALPTTTIPPVFKYVPGSVPRERAGVRGGTSILSALLAIALPKGTR